MDCAQCEMCNLADARYLCPELCCLIYLCEPCWTEVHKRRGLLHHRPMTKTKPGSPMRNISNCVTAFPFLNPPMDHLNHSQSGLRSSNQQQLCHCSKFWNSEWIESGTFKQYGQSNSKLCVFVRRCDMKTYKNVTFIIYC